jgi:hypothetical protein
MAGNTMLVTDQGSGEQACLQSEDQRKSTAKEEPVDSNSDGYDDEDTDESDEDLEKSRIQPGRVLQDATLVKMRLVEIAGKLAPGITCTLLTLESSCEWSLS